MYDPSDEIQELLDEPFSSFQREISSQRHVMASARPINRGAQFLEARLSVEDGAPEGEIPVSIAASGVNAVREFRRTKLRSFGATAMTVCWTLASSALLYLVFSGSPRQQGDTVANLSLDQFNKVMSQRGSQEATNFKVSNLAERLLNWGIS